MPAWASHWLRPARFSSPEPDFAEETINRRHLLAPLSAKLWKSPHAVPPYQLPSNTSDDIRSANG